jgi:hypothetical protein
MIIRFPFTCDSFTSHSRNVKLSVSLGASRSRSAPASVTSKMSPSRRSGDQVTTAAAARTSNFDLCSPLHPHHLCRLITLLPIAIRGTIKRVFLHLKLLDSHQTKGITTMASLGLDSLPLQPPRRVSSIRAQYFNVASTGLSTKRSLISGGISPGRRTDGPVSRGDNGPFHRSRLASVAHAYPFSLFNSPVPDSSADPLTDVEAGCGPWGTLAGKPARPWLRSRLQRKARNPTACDSIGYEVVHQDLTWKFIAFATFMAMWSMTVPILLTGLKKLEEKTGLSFLPRVELFTFVMFWVEGILALALAFLYSLGCHRYTMSRYLFMLKSLLTMA